jgi:hypothetical protein
MQRRLRWLIAVSLTGFWTLGIWFICSKMPVAPHEGWQPSKGEVPCALLSDGNSVLTVNALDANNPGAAREFCLRDLTTGLSLYTVSPSSSTEFDFGFFWRGNFFSFYSIDRAESTNQRKLLIHDASSGKLLHEFVTQTSWPYLSDWFHFSEDGKRLTLRNRNEIEIWDVPTSRKIFTVAEGRPDCCFSAVGNRVAFRRNSGIAVYDISKKGQLIAQIGSFFSPQLLSPHGSQLIDTHHQLWDVATGKLKLLVNSVVDGTIDFCEFSKDGKYLVIITNELHHGVWVNYVDAETGVPLEKRKTQLFSGDTQFLFIALGGSQRRWIVLSNLKVAENPGGVNPSTSPQWGQWLAQVPGFAWLDQEDVSGEYLVYDLDTAKIIAKGPAFQASSLGDGDYLVVSDGNRNTRIWDIPPRKPRKLMALLCLGWTACFSLPVAWSCVRRWIHTKRRLRVHSTS